MQATGAENREIPFGLIRPFSLSSERTHTCKRPIAKTHTHTPPYLFLGKLLDQRLILLYCAGHKSYILVIWYIKCPEYSKLFSHYYEYLGIFLTRTLKVRHVGFDLPPCTSTDQTERWPSGARSVLPSPYVHTPLFFRTGYSRKSRHFSKRAFSNLFPSPMALLSHLLMRLFFFFVRFMRSLGKTPNAQGVL